MGHNIKCYEFNFEGDAACVSQVIIIAGDYPIRPCLDELSRRDVIEKVVFTPGLANEADWQAYRNILNDTALPLMREGYHVSGYHKNPRERIGNDYDREIVI